MLKGSVHILRGQVSHLNCWSILAAVDYKVGGNGNVCHFFFFIVASVLLEFSGMKSNGVSGLYSRVSVWEQGQFLMLTQKIALCWYYTTKGCRFLLTGFSCNHDMLFWALPRSIFLSFNFINLCLYYFIFPAILKFFLPYLIKYSLFSLSSNNNARLWLEINW